MIPSVEAVLQDLTNALSLEIEEQIVRATPLRVGSAHIETTEGMYPHHSPGRATVDVQVADPDRISSQRDALGITAEEGTR